MSLRVVIMLRVGRGGVVMRVFLLATATSTVGLGSRVLRQKLLPALFAAKVKRLTLAFGVVRRRFVHRHSADRIFGHGLVFLCRGRRLPKRSEARN
jgi:hypothetical protein